MFFVKLDTEIAEFDMDIGKYDNIKFDVIQDNQNKFRNKDENVLTLVI